MDRKTPEGKALAAPAWPALAARLAVGAVLIGAGALKAAAPAEEFAVIIEAYGLVSMDAAMTLAAFLPWIELLAGWSLLLGLFSRAAAAVAGAQFSVFIIALLSLKARGIELPNCGCFGGGLHPSPSQTLLLDAAMLAACLWLWRRGPGRLSLDNWSGRGYTRSA